MSLGENIFKLRKQNGLSQEQLGEQVDVTRQTISNWELADTAPNPEQLKRLSKVFNVTIDELLDNEAKEVLMKKVSNTEKLAGMIIKVLKIIGIVVGIYLILLTVSIVGLSIYAFTKKANTVSDTKTASIYQIMDNKYQPTPALPYPLNIDDIIHD